MFRKYNKFKAKERQGVIMEMVALGGVKTILSDSMKATCVVQMMLRWGMRWWEDEGPIGCRVLG